MDENNNTPSYILQTRSKMFVRSFVEFIHKKDYEAVHPLSNICEIICPILFALTHYINICVKMSGINYSNFLSNN